MGRGAAGEFQVVSRTGGEVVRAFVPRDLPPDPPLVLGPAQQAGLDAALLALGRLDSATRFLPAPDMFLFGYLRKEAVLSSQIEGTQSSLSDLLLFEQEDGPDPPVEDVREVANYVMALQHGLARLAEGFPLSNRLLREVHALLLRDTRGGEHDPGEFRRSQNWIGGSRPGDAAFVPPPAHLVPDLMGGLERWYHAPPDQVPVLVKAALAHVQLETIHPFLDGNGRVGRLLVSLLLHADGVLRQPLLYLSLYLKEHRAQYYALLDQVRFEGAWEEWIEFFATGVRETAEGGLATIERVVAMFEADRARIATIGRPAGSALRVHEALQTRPLSTIGRLQRVTGLTPPTILKSLEHLERLGLVHEITGRRRNRVFSYQPYLQELSAGT